MHPNLKSIELINGFQKAQKILSFKNIHYSNVRNNYKTRRYEIHKSITKWRLII